MNKIIFLIFWIIFFSPNLFSQIVNTDREINIDTTKNGYLISSTSLSTNKQKSNIWNVNSKIEAGRYFNNNYMILGLSRTNFVLSGKDIVQNEGMLHLRYRDADTRKISHELFAQYQWNGAWGMVSRRLIGANLRAKIIEDGKKDLYSGTGIFKEWETWNWSGVKEIPAPIDQDEFNRDMFRLNQYLKWAIKINEDIDFSTVSFLQFPLTGQFFKARWNMDANLNMKVSKGLSVVVKWNHMYDKNRLVPIDAFYYSFETGMQFNW